MGIPGGADALFVAAPAFVSTGAIYESHLNVRTRAYCSRVVIRRMIMRQADPCESKSIHSQARIANLKFARQPESGVGDAFW